MTDQICMEAVNKMLAKYTKGVEEHGGVGMEKADLPLIEWLKMLQEEHMDAVFYIEKIMHDLQSGQ